MVHRDSTFTLLEQELEKEMEQVVGDGVLLRMVLGFHIFIHVHEHVLVLLVLYPQFY